MKVTEIRATSLISKSGLPGADFVINPYGGCSHACVYCYARFMKRFSGHDEKWGQYVDVKVNAAELVPPREEGLPGLDSPSRYAGKRIFMSSVTDPYLPQEWEYRLTRAILERLIPHQPSLGIQTKSALITRDIDILARFRDCEAGLTLTTLDDGMRRELEPGTSSVNDRLRALAELRDAGLRTYVFIGPIIPAITDWKAIIDATSDRADFYYLENLNIAGSVGHDMAAWYRARHPGLLAAYEAAYAPGSSFWDDTEAEIEAFCASRGVEGRVYFHHGRR
ncbi:MAG TPA: radical SAM protein [Treponemataceae bacterium]|nr:radical SAM protein [Treponemataceae bacterium]